MSKELEEFIAAQAGLFGNKSANLMVLDSLCKSSSNDGKVLVPNFFPLSHEICTNHLDTYASEWKDIWGKYLDSQRSHPGVLTNVDLDLLNNLRMLIEKTFQEHMLPEEVLNSYLSTLDSGDLLMVRSSGKEDSQDLANPGGNISLASIEPTLQSVSTAIGKVVASYFSEKSLQQRLKGNDDITSSPLMSVLIQKMVGEKSSDELDKNVVYSGVMYTGNHGTTIHGAHGHGELIVSGNRPYDSFYVTAENVVYREVMVKTHRMVPYNNSGEHDIKSDSATGGLKFKKNHKSLQTSSIPNSALWRLNEIGREIEKKYGQSMDVEWVYRPNKDKPEEGIIYIVQARPIPKGKSQDAISSSIKPDKVKLVKEKVTPIIGEVISVAGKEARIITGIDQIRIFDTIEEALDAYLKMDHSNIKAIIVKQPSAPNSHAAAEFNSVSIPVLKMNQEQILRIEKLVEDDNICLVVDPQRKQVFDARPFLITNDHVEDQLFDLTTGILSKGLFKSAMTSKTTVDTAPYMSRQLDGSMASKMPVDMAPYMSRELKTTPLVVVPHSTKLGDLLHIIETASVFEASSAFQVLMSKYFELLSVKPSKKFSSLSELHDALEIIEASGSENVKDSKKALGNILNLFFRLAIKESTKNSDSKVFKVLLSQALAICLEISQILDSLEVASQSKGHDKMLQESLLNLTNKLDAIIFNPGDTETLSSSLLQEVLEKKAFKKIESIIIDNSLDKESAEFFLQFSKLSKFACNNFRKDQWLAFALESSKNDQSRSKLANLINYFVSKNIPSFFINQMFGEEWSETPDGPNKASKVLDSLFLKSARSIKNLSALSFNAIQEILDSWEHKIVDWGKIDNFDMFMKQFAIDMDRVLSLLGSIDLNNIGTLDKSFVISEVNRLTEIIDNSIKSLKSSAEYSTDRGLQAYRFAEMLKIYHRLMSIQVNLIPDDVVRGYRKNVENNFVSKKAILSNIETVFNRILENVDEQQLSTSGEFSVHSAVISSPACFERQFVNRKNLTLEDCFTLFHQNIIDANVYLGRDLEPKEADLPKPVQIVINYFKEHMAYRTSKNTSLSEDKHPANLINVIYKYPCIELNYNIPLAYHGAQFCVKFDVNTSRITIESKIYGDARDRFSKICDFANAYNQLAGFSSERGAWFNAERSLLNSTYMLPPNASTEDVANACHIVLEMSSMSFNTYSVNLMELMDIAIKRLPNKICEDGLKSIVDICWNDRNASASLDEVKKLFTLSEKIDKTILDHFLTLALKKVLSNEFKSLEGIQIYETIQKRLNPESYMEKISNALIDSSVSYLELCIKYSLDEMALKLLDQADPKKHTNALSNVLERQNGDLNDDDKKLIGKLLEKGFFSFLSETNENKLLRSLPELSGRYNFLKTTFRPAGRNIGRFR